MDLHSKMITYVTSTTTSPVTKTAKTSKWLRLKTHGGDPVNVLSGADIESYIWILTSSLF